MEGAVLGTPPSMAPEQARGEVSEVDRRADVYALGVILHEILYLQPPVRGASREEVVEKVAAGRHDAPEPGRPASAFAASARFPCRGLPQSHGIAREERYQQVQDLQADITAYQSGFATSAEQAGAAKQFALFVKRNRRVTIAVAAALLALAAVSAWFTFHLARASWEASTVTRRRQRERHTQVRRPAPRREQERMPSARSPKSRAPTPPQRAPVGGGGIRRQGGRHPRGGRPTAGSGGKLHPVGTRGRRHARLDAAVELLPEDPQFLMRRADLHQLLWRFNDAVRDYEAALAQAPDEKASRNLALSRELAAGNAADARRARTAREGTHGAGSRGEIPLMYRRPTTGKSPPVRLRRGVAFGALEIVRRAGAVAGQERIETLPDGTLRLIFRGLQVAGFVRLRGLECGS